MCVGPEECFVIKIILNIIMFLPINSDIRPGYADAAATFCDVQLTFLPTIQSFFFQFFTESEIFHLIDCLSPTNFPLYTVVFANLPYDIEIPHEYVKINIVMLKFK